MKSEVISTFLTNAHFFTALKCEPLVLNWSKWIWSKCKWNLAEGFVHLTYTPLINRNIFITTWCDFRESRYSDSCGISAKSEKWSKKKNSTFVSRRELWMGRSAWREVM